MYNPSIDAHGHGLGVYYFSAGVFVSIVQIELSFFVLWLRTHPLIGSTCMTSGCEGNIPVAMIQLCLSKSHLLIYKIMIDNNKKRMKISFI